MFFINLIISIICSLLYLVYFGVNPYYNQNLLVSTNDQHCSNSYLDTIPGASTFKHNRHDTIDKYQALAIQLENKIKELKIEVELNKIKLSNIYQYLTSEYRVNGNKAFTEKYKNFSFDCYEVYSKNLGAVNFFLHDSNGCNISSISNLNSVIRKKSRLLVFATNAGMYTNEQLPVGLYIENGKIVTKTDFQKGLYGNFYIQPNGVFFIDTSLHADIVSTDNINAELINKMKFATQSGPMLVIDSMININFKEGSSNVNIRSGVGIKDNGNIVFVISNEKINFYDFAAFFKFNLKCSDALYLDGAISETYLPELGRRQNGGSFGPMIGVVK